MTCSSDVSSLPYNAAAMQRVPAQAERERLAEGAPDPVNSSGP
jgi:hypothetical protein